MFEYKNEKKKTTTQREALTDAGMHDCFSLKFRRNTLLVSFERGVSNTITFQTIRNEGTCATWPFLMKGIGMKVRNETRISKKSKNETNKTNQIGNGTHGDSIPQELTSSDSAKVMSPSSSSSSCWCKCRMASIPNLSWFRQSASSRRQALPSVAAVTGDPPLPDIPIGNKSN